MNLPLSLQEEKLKKYQEARVLYIENILKKDIENYSIVCDSKQALIISYERNAHPILLSWTGSKTKPNHYRYSSKEIRQNVIDKILETSKKEESSPKDASSVNIGDIFVSSWGYDQTNVDFYEVIEKRGKCTLFLRRINQTRYFESEMSGKCSPIRGEYIGDTFKKRLSNDRIRFDSFRSGYKIETEVIGGVELIPSFFWSFYS